jgi:hypothetical protein
MPPTAALVKTSPSDPVRISGFPLPAATPTVGACFGEFLRRVVPSHTAYALARSACEDVALALQAELRPGSEEKPKDDSTQRSDFLVIGSVGKRSAVAPITTVDLLYLLPEKLAAQKSADALKIIWAVIKNRYEEVRNTESGVLLQRREHRLKIIPGRARCGAFLIPARPTTEKSSDWIVTNPIAEAATLRLSDSLYGGRPRLLLTALKIWRAHADVPIEPYALELLAQEFYSGSPRPFELERALIEFWAWARKRTPCALKPPGGQSPLNVGDEWHQKAKAAYWRAILASHHLKNDKIVEAALEWRHMLGPIFPVPGETAPLAPPMFK